MPLEPKFDLVSEELPGPQSLWRRVSGTVTSGFYNLLLKFEPSNKYRKFAGIEYIGRAGSSVDCQDAVCRLLQYGNRIARVRILTAGNEHCLLLSNQTGDLFAVKSGFASGYAGQGPKTLSYVLKLLEAHNAEIEECIVAPDILRKIDACCLLCADIDDLKTTPTVQPDRLYDYILPHHWEIERNGTLWKEFPAMPPFAVIDGRIVDLAKSFWDGPDDKLMVGYRRLEDIVRSRTALEEHGHRLFARAFSRDEGPLEWPNIDNGEHAGRAQLFSGAYMAYRNRRAHREPKREGSTLTEFLLLNHLYLLEGEAKDRSRSEERGACKR